MKRIVKNLLVLFISLLYLPFSLQSQNNEVKRWIPYTLPWDDMPLDLSFVYKNDIPAGKRGFLKV